MIAVYILAVIGGLLVAAIVGFFIWSFIESLIKEYKECRSRMRCPHEHIFDTVFDDKKMGHHRMCDRCFKYFKCDKEGKIL